MAGEAYLTPRTLVVIGLSGSEQPAGKSLWGGSEPIKICLRGQSPPKHAIGASNALLRF